MDITVYRDVLGEGDRVRKYDCDVEIVRKEGPMTRATTAAIKNRNLFAVVLIWSHYKTREIEQIKLTKEQEKELEENVWSLKSDYEGGVPTKNWFAIKEEDQRRNILCMNIGKSKAVDTVLVENGLDRVLHAIRARRCIERRTFLCWIWPASQETIEFDLFRLCLCFATKLKTAKSIEAPVTHREYESALTRLVTDDSFTSVVVDGEILFERTMEALGKEIMTHKRRTMDQLKKLLSESEQKFNLPFDQWNDGEAFVRGVWNLYLS